jgi:hypothetical protein
VLEGEHPDVVVVHLQPGALSEAYFERISIAAGGGRIVVVEESGPLRLRARAPQGVAFLSRRELRELVESIRELATAGG